MATTRLISMHQNKGKSITDCLADRTDYAKNPDKTNDGEYISSYECDPKTIQGEFLLSKRIYLDITGREQTNDVIAYQIRQSFKPGEITPELANQVGYDLGMRFTKGNHAFFVATHIDKSHIHNHIIFNSTSLDCTKKFRDFLGKSKEQKKFIRLRSLRSGYSEEEIKAVIDGKKPFSNRKNATEKTQSHVNLLVDIQAKLQAGKGAGYERWAKIFNLKQMAQTINFLTENNLLLYKDLEEKAQAVTDNFNQLSVQIKAAEKRMTEIASLKTHIINYSKTREIYMAYRKAGYSKKFYEKHTADLRLHKAAKAAFDSLEGKKLPTVKALQMEYSELLSEKKKAYGKYHSTKKEMQDILIAKANVDRLLGENILEKEKEKSQEQR